MHSIRFKFYAFFSALILLLIAIMNYFPLTISRDMLIEQKDTAMSGQASVISSALSNLPELNEESVSEVMGILDISDYTRILICSGTGRVVYDTAGAVGAGTSDEDILTALKGKTVFRSTFADSAFASRCVYPVSYQDRITGAVYLYEYDAERAEVILGQQAGIRNLSLVISAAALVISLVYFHSFYARIKDMVTSMHIVGAGDYSHRLITKGKDELTELGGEFNLLTEQLETNEKQRRQFVADASHELKTPLASIRLLSDSIVQNADMDTATVREFVTDIGSEANRLQRTTEKLLALSRLDDNVTVVPEPVDIKQVSFDVLSAVDPLAAERNIVLKAEMEDGCVIMATSDDIFRIVFNLVENAVKYNSDGGEVTVTAGKEGSQVKLKVADTGIGIPEEDRLNIFSRFYRVDKARSREAGGSGLGLSIVHDTVLLYGGTISVGANKPKGSVFIVSFPAATEDETGI